MFHDLFVWNHTQIESKESKDDNQIVYKKEDKYNLKKPQRMAHTPFQNMKFTPMNFNHAL
jgi:hypothetical protein